MAITPKEKELAAVGISVAAGCKPCTTYHVKAARKANVSDDEIKQAVTDALTMRQSATAMMADYARAQLGEAGQGSDIDRNQDTNRVKTLIAVGAAFGVNCVSNLQAQLAAAQTMGIAQDDIDQIARLAVFIKRRAASHVERLVGLEEAEDEVKARAAYEAAFGG